MAPRTSSRTRPRPGFTLIEAIAAIIIIAVALPPMFWALADAQVQRVNPVLASRARWLATERLEDILADRYSPVRGYSWLVVANYPAETPVPGHPQFEREVQFQDLAPDLVTPGTGRRRATVIVRWTDATGNVQNFSTSVVLASMIL